MDNFKTAEKNLQKDFERKQIDLPNVSDVGIQSSYFHKENKREDWKAQGKRMTYQSLMIEVENRNLTNNIKAI